MTQKITYLFFFLSAIYCVITALSINLPIDWLIKILPILTLLMVNIRHYKTQNTPSLRLFIIGLVFCMGGDIFLSVDREQLFIFGLGSFLIGHVFYIASLTPVLKKHHKGLIPLVIYGVIMLTVLTPHLAELLIPVIVYMLVLLVMTAAAITSHRSNFYLIIGGVAFTISDSIIGLSKFYISIPQSGLWIMLTYYLAQYCLTKGFLSSKE